MKIVQRITALMLMLSLLVGPGQMTVIPAQATEESGGTCSHSYDAVITLPTCTEEGFTTYSCSICGDSYTGDPQPATGHSYDTVVTTPTCTEDGFTTHTCAACGDSYVDAVIPAGHVYDEGTVTDPGCITEGYTTFTCTVCGSSYRDQYTDPTGHIYENIFTEATCTENGYTTYLCICGESYDIPSHSAYALGHSYEQEKCIRCQKDECGGVP